MMKRPFQRLSKRKKKPWRISVGSINGGSADTPQATLVPIANRSFLDLLENGITAAYDHPDVFKFDVLVSGQECSLLVCRTDAPHGWGAHLDVTLRSGTGRPSIPVVHVISNTTVEKSGVNTPVRIEVQGYDPAAGHRVFYHLACNPRDVTVELSHDDGSTILVCTPEVDDLDMTIEVLCTSQEIDLDKTGKWRRPMESSSSTGSSPVLEPNEFGYSWILPPEGSPEFSLLMKSWLDPNRKIHADLEPVLNTIALRREILSHDPLNADSKVVMSSSSRALPDGPILSSSTVQRALVNMTPALQWRMEVFKVSLKVIGAKGDVSQSAALIDTIRMSSDACRARALQCCFDVVSLARSLCSTGSRSQDSTPESQQLRDVLLRKISEMKTVAFRQVFLLPAERLLRSQGRRVEADDVQVHASNTYRALLLATLDIIADREPYLFDEQKRAPKFLSRGEFRGDSLFDIANGCLDSEADGKRQRREVKPYLEAYAAKLSWASVVEPLIQTILQDAATSSLCANVLGIRRDEMNEFFYNEDYALDEDNVALLICTKLELLRKTAP